LARQKDTS